MYPFEVRSSPGLSNAEYGNETLLFPDSSLLGSFFVYVMTALTYADIASLST